MATGDKKRAVMTDDINNSGSPYPVMPLKTIDQTPTAGNTDHLISSAGVKSALDSLSTTYSRQYFLGAGMGSTLYIRPDALSSSIFFIAFSRNDATYCPAYGTIFYQAGAGVNSAFTTNAGTGTNLSVTVSLENNMIKLVFSTTYVRVMVFGTIPFELSNPNT